MLSTFLCALRSKEALLTQTAPAQGGKAAIRALRSKEELLTQAALAQGGKAVIEGAPHILGGIEPLAI